MNITNESDESPAKMEESITLKRRVTDDIRHHFDDCCVHRARFFSRKYWEGEVKVKRQFFRMKRRYMILFEDGTVLLLRRGHIRAEFDLTENKTDITLNKQTRFTIK